MMVGDINSPDETIGVSITHHFDNTFGIKSGVLYIQGFLWYIEDTDFKIFSSENSTVQTWVSFDLHPTPLFRVMFKVSYSSDAPSTTVVSGQTSNYNTIQNPLVTGENMDYRIQISYAL